MQTETGVTVTGSEYMAVDTEKMVVHMGVKGYNLTSSTPKTYISRTVTINPTTAEVSSDKSVDIK